MNKHVNRKFSMIAVNYQPHFDASFLGKVFKDKINTSSIMVTVDLRLAMKQITDLSTLDVNNISGHSPSSNCVTVANNTCRFIDVFNNNTVSFRFSLVHYFYYRVDVLACFTCSV
jgi:hypothetical protein